MKRFNDFNLFEESLSNAKDINATKILIHVNGGLGDAIGSLEGVLMFANKYGFEPRQIYWKSPQYYSNLDKYLSFKEINYIDTSYNINYEEYTHVITRSNNNCLGTTKKLRLTLQDYLTFTSVIEEESNKYKSEIGLHIRVKEYENGRKLNSLQLSKSLENAHNLIIKKFEKIYKPEKQYFAATDSPLVNDYLSKYINVLYIPKQEYVHKSSEDPFFQTLDLAILSKCKEIYGLGSPSGYPHLARSLSKNDSIFYKLLTY